MVQDNAMGQHIDWVIGPNTGQVQVDPLNRGCAIAASKLDLEFVFAGREPVNVNRKRFESERQASLLSLILSRAILVTDTMDQKLPQNRTAASSQVIFRRRRCPGHYSLYSSTASSWE